MEAVETSGRYSRLTSADRRKMFPEAGFGGGWPCGGGYGSGFFGPGVGGGGVVVPRPKGGKAGKAAAKMAAAVAKKAGGGAGCKKLNRQRLLVGEGNSPSLVRKPLWCVCVGGSFVLVLVLTANHCTKKL